MTVRKRVAPSSEYSFRLDCEPELYFGCAVESIEQSVTDQATKLARRHPHGSHFDPAVAGLALGTGNIRLSHDHTSLSIRADQSNVALYSAGVDCRMSIRNIGLRDLIDLAQCVAPEFEQDICMKISSLMCTSCKASYEVAEAMTVMGRPGSVVCIGCGATLASWREPKAIVFRLVLPPEQKYSHVPVPPSPAISPLA